MYLVYFNGGFQPPTGIARTILTKRTATVRYSFLTRIENYTDNEGPQHAMISNPLRKSALSARERVLVYNRFKTFSNPIEHFVNSSWAVATTNAPGALTGAWSLYNTIRQKHNVGKQLASSTLTPENMYHKKYRHHQQYYVFFGKISRDIGSCTREAEQQQEVSTPAVTSF